MLLKDRDLCEFWFDPEETIRNWSFAAELSQCFPSLRHVPQEGFLSSHCQGGSVYHVNFLPAEMNTLVRLSLHPLHPVRDRVMLVFFRRGGAGLYIVFVSELLYRKRHYYRRLAYGNVTCDDSVDGCCR